jgi:hypothetical protein
MEKYLILYFDAAHEYRTLSVLEYDLRKDLKIKGHGTGRIIARQDSRINWLVEGDTHTPKFHRW